MQKTACSYAKVIFEIAWPGIELGLFAALAFTAGWVVGTAVSAML